jgi:lysophospholipase L1-like esterase
MQDVLEGPGCDNIPSKFFKNIKFQILINFLSQVRESRTFFSRHSRKASRSHRRIDMLSKLLVAILITICTLAAGQDEWVDAMKAVHAKGGSEKGSVSQIGDSITYSMAFLAGMGGLKSDEWKELKARVNTKILRDRKGAAHCNMSGWTASQGAAKVRNVVAAEKPEIAVIMYGTNDARTKSGAVADFKKHLASIVDACIDVGCVPIISTIPPILNKDARVAEFNDAIKSLALEKKIPLVDFNAEIRARYPDGGWDGTLLGKGDVHPTGGALFDFGDANLMKSGYALRNFLTCKAMKEVIEKCF